MIDLSVSLTERPFNDCGEGLDICKTTTSAWPPHPTTQAGKLLITLNGNYLQMKEDETNKRLFTMACAKCNQTVKFPLAFIY